MYNSNSTHSCGDFGWVSAEFVHQGIDSRHIRRIDLFPSISFGKVLDELIHGGLIVADSGRDGVHCLLASGECRVRGGHGDEGWEDIENDELKRSR